MDAGLLADRLRQLIPEWRHAEILLTPLAGGITNTNYRVEVADKSYVVRVEAPSSAVLAINRDQEWHNSQQASAIGIAPRALHRFDNEKLSVREFLPGRTLSAAELRTPGNPLRLAELLRRLHSGPKFRGEFDLASTARGYVERIDRSGWQTSADYPARCHALDRLQVALGPRPSKLSSCHNDLLAENFLDDGREWRLIDFEYSGNNDPCFELGNLCRELDFDDRAIDELCHAYFVSPAERDFARVRLNMLLSDVGWSLWAIVQEHGSAVEFDYASYGKGRWQRAAATLESAEFSRLAAAARQAT